MTNVAFQIDLFQAGPVLGVRSPSPFCVKLEAWLRLAGLTYRSHSVVDPRKGPKGKVPWISLGGESMGDSSMIIERLTERTGSDLDSGLPANDRAVAAAFAGMIEERLYWAMVWERWFDPEIWPTIKKAIFDPFPAHLRFLLPAPVKRDIGRTLFGQGTSRHDPSEIRGQAIGDIASIATFLGDKPFFMGDRPRLVDATLYGFLTNLIDVRLDGPLNRAARDHDNLVAYTARMGETCFGEQAEASRAA